MKQDWTIQQSLYEYRLWRDRPCHPLMSILCRLLCKRGGLLLRWVIEGDLFHIPAPAGSGRPNVLTLTRNRTAFWENAQDSCSAKTQRHSALLKLECAFELVTWRTCKEAALDFLSLEYRFCIFYKLPDDADLAGRWTNLQQQDSNQYMFYSYVKHTPRLVFLKAQYMLPSPGGLLEAWITRPHPRSFWFIWIGAWELAYYQVSYWYSYWNLDHPLKTTDLCQFLPHLRTSANSFKNHTWFFNRR